jgi:2-succinyl-5-enolpyruvyl-6-hydroxy-3-cyclohexene-1-carboxylate synthase
MVYQPIYDIAQLCFQKGIRQVVLCPGSRCAPLTLAFTRHGGFKIYVFSDERSAAFIALGIAQQTKQTVVLICTSGSAVYNFAPAVAEAFFSEIPLLILSADRPTEWIGQHDGQTIFQQGIFGKHVKASYQLPQEYEHADNQWAINRIVNEAINTTSSGQQGPVHINAPFREPLYPSKEEVIKFSETVRIIEQIQSEFHLAASVKNTFKEQWKLYSKVLIVCGQEDGNTELTQILYAASTQHNIPVIADIISNQHGLDNSIQHADAFLANASASLKNTLQPELLITFGKSIIAKQVKLFLRNNKPQAHWHIQTSGVAPDTFQSLSSVATVTSEVFFTFLNELDKSEITKSQERKEYQQTWQAEEKKSKHKTNTFFPQNELCEFEVVKQVLENLPDNTSLHLANSMSVRYANYIGLSNKKSSVSVFSNRGTSGIDGCISTVVGHCLADPNNLNVLITGDIAFFYDRNAFWHNYKLPNLRIVLLNNHGGVIFNLIDRPAALPEADEYFVTHQKLSAKKLCEEFGFDHLTLHNKQQLKSLSSFLFNAEKNTKILEIESDTSLNKTIFESFKKHLQ